MKVLHISDYGESKLNGIYSAVSRLAEEQRKLGAVVREGMVTPHQSIIDNCLKFNVKKFEQYKNLIGNFAPDIIIFNGLYPYQQILFSWLANKKSIPYIIVYHGGASKDNAKKGFVKKKIANFFFWNRFIYRAKAVVYLNQNEYTKSVFKKQNGNFYIIPNGIDIPVSLNCPMAKSKINICFVSRMDYKGKGLDVLFKVVDELKTEGWSDKIQFSFYGGQYDETPNILEKYGDYAKYYGFVSGKAKEKAYKDADVLILPSRSEGMPMCVLEALSYGVPCIVTPQTNMADIINENKCGWVSTLDVDNLKQAIKDSYVGISKNKVQYFENCRNVIRQFAWSKVANSTIEMYKEIIERNRHER